jgi:hypothetical protein
VTTAPAKTSTATTPATTATTATTPASTTPKRTTPKRTTKTSPGKTQTTQTATKPLPPPTHVRLPATFTIAPGGTLNPPVIAVPSSLPIELTVVSADGHAHHVVLQTSKPHALSVPANGKASVLLTGLKKGDYKLLVDGAVRGSLSIGVQVGP